MPDARGGQPPSPDDHHAWRRARRAVARKHHPDLGGDAEIYVHEMRVVDEQFRVHSDRPSTIPADQRWPSGRAMVVGRAARRARRRAKFGLRRFRGKLPPRFPGSRRYFDL